MTKFEKNPANIIIVQYAPTNDHSDEEIEEFYADVKKALKQEKSGDILIVMGDKIWMQKLAKGNMVALLENNYSVKEMKEEHIF